MSQAELLALALAGLLVAITLLLCLVVLLVWFLLKQKRAEDARGAEARLLASDPRLGR